MISGVPAVAAHAGIDIITAALSEGGELRLVVPADGAVSRDVYLTCLDHQVPRFSGLVGALTRHQAPVWRKGGLVATAR